MHSLTNFQDLVEKAQQLNLYTALVLQLNKDFQLANIDVNFHEDILPTSLKLLFHEKLFQLIQNDLSSYLNLLYIMDVPEKQVRELDIEDTVKLAEQVMILMLKREWQKVWYRSQY